MRLLLDTHIFLWCITEDRKLSKTAKAKITQADEVYVSSASIWEMSIKINLNKLEADINELVEAISESGFLELSVTSRHAAEICSLAGIHRDPFDRILISQAITEPLIFLTADTHLQEYSKLVEIV